MGKKKKYKDNEMSVSVEQQQEYSNLFDQMIHSDNGVQQLVSGKKMDMESIDYLLGDEIINEIIGSKNNQQKTHETELRTWGSEIQQYESSDDQDQNDSEYDENEMSSCNPNTMVMSSYGNLPDYGSTPGNQVGFQAFDFHQSCDYTTDDDEELDYCDDSQDEQDDDSSFQTASIHMLNESLTGIESEVYGADDVEDYNDDYKSPVLYSDKCDTVGCIQCIDNQPVNSINVMCSTVFGTLTLDYNDTSITIDVINIINDSDDFKVIGANLRNMYDESTINVELFVDMLIQAMMLKSRPTSVLKLEDFEELDAKGYTKDTPDDIVQILQYNDYILLYEMDPTIVDTISSMLYEYRDDSFDVCTIIVLIIQLILDERVGVLLTPKSIEQFMKLIQDMKDKALNYFFGQDKNENPDVTLSIPSRGQYMDLHSDLYDFIFAFDDEEDEEEIPDAVCREDEDSDDDEFIPTYSTTNISTLPGDVPESFKNSDELDDDDEDDDLYMSEDFEEVMDTYISGNETPMPTMDSGPEDMNPDDVVLDVDNSEAGHFIIDTVPRKQ